MPSLMLKLSGEDKSTMRRHAFVWCLLGMMPIGLIWAAGTNSFGPKGPKTRPASHSVLRYLSITSGWSDAEIMFPLADLRG